MPVVISPESELGKELCRWEQHRTKYVGDDQQPGNPYVFRPYPKMLYKAQVWPHSGQARCMAPAPDLYAYDRPDLYERAILESERFTSQCQCIVPNEGAELIKRGQGWAETPEKALELYEKQQQDIANASAEMAYAAQRMSRQAKEELAEADRSTAAHVIDVVGGKKTRSHKKARAIAPMGEES